MFYYLAGTIAVLETGLAVLDCGGVGYELNVSDVTMRKLTEIGKGKHGRLYTHFQVREDAAELYGFYEEKERQMFRALLTVSGVGPKVALAILNLLTPDRLIAAVLAEDVKTIAKASGVGSKTAARVVLELKDRFGKTYGMTEEGGFEGMIAAPTASVTSNQSDAINALLALGFTRTEAITALHGMDLRGKAVEDIIRECLRRMGDRA